jgi:predicted pyridoxine 5'-phosphate oxidase superfamily flavin-nucleotide-binding protein
MMQIPEVVRRMMLDQGIIWVATSSKDGAPNVSPRSAFWVTDDGALAWCDWFKHKTFWNWQENNRVAVAVVDASTFTGWQLKGGCESVGDPSAISAALQNAVSKPHHPLFNKTIELHAGEYSPIVVEFRTEQIYALAPMEASKDPLQVQAK